MGAATKWPSRQRFSSYNEHRHPGVLLKCRSDPADGWGAGLVRELWVSAYVISSQIHRHPRWGAKLYKVCFQTRI